MPTAEKVCAPTRVPACNVWVYRGSEANCGKRHRQCWLKHAKDKLSIATVRAQRARGTRDELRRIIPRTSGAASDETNAAAVFTPAFTPPAGGARWCSAHGSSASAQNSLAQLRMMPSGPYASPPSKYRDVGAIDHRATAEGGRPPP